MPRPLRNARQTGAYSKIKTPRDKLSQGAKGAVPPMFAGELPPLFRLTRGARPPLLPPRGLGAKARKGIPDAPFGRPCSRRAALSGQRRPVRLSSSSHLPITFTIKQTRAKVNRLRRAAQDFLAEDAARERRPRLLPARGRACLPLPQRSPPAQKRRKEANNAASEASSSTSRRSRWRAPRRR